MGKQGLKLQRSLSIAFILFFGIGQASGSDTCHTIERANQIININETRRTLGDAVRVLRGLELENSQKCKGECCAEPDCSVYVFYSLPGGKKPNCYLVNCTPTDSCVFTNLTNSVVGVRTLSDEKQARELNNSGDSLEQMKPTSTSWKVAVTNNTIQSLQSMGNETMNATTPFVTTPTETESPTRSTIHEEHRKNGKNHTTIASLIIALFFGILFLFAVIVLIGQPWWHSFHRPLYSKVDYLMNGL